MVVKKLRDTTMYPIDPYIFYDEEELKGLVRINRRLIEKSHNVVEFQPFILQRYFDLYGESGLLIIYDFYVRNGYIRSDKAKKKNK